MKLFMPYKIITLWGGLHCTLFNETSHTIQNHTSLFYRGVYIALCIMKLFMPYKIMYPYFMGWFALLYYTKCNGNHPIK